MILAIIQARVGSTRFPSKVLKRVGNDTLLSLMVQRLKKSALINEIAIATTEESEDDELLKLAEELGVHCYRGSKNDVLDRFYRTAEKYNPDLVLRLTGDCPLIDWSLIDEAINKLILEQLDNCNNTYPPTFPDGLDFEVMTFETLQRTWLEATSEYDREHVTPYIHSSGKFKTGSIFSETNYSDLRITVDEPVDLDVIQNICSNFGDIYFSWKDIIQLYLTSPSIFQMNMNIKRNEGSSIGTGQKLWKRAKNIIPGGNMLLSKRSEMFLPDFWPSYFSKAKGCYVWDLDDLRLTDVSIMGIGTNTLGYGNDKVDEAVQKIVFQGNMSTLNCPEEVYLAEALIELHPWADMAKFTRSGGEANAVAIRIARAAAGKSKVAVCGYHGWHDWYLAANLAGEGLAGHLLPGLEPKGVHQGLQDSIFTFSYNNLEELESLIQNHDIGVIFMEVKRNFEPENNFLQNVRNLADQHGIVLVFDECTSGFRETYGGLHLKYNVQPDLAMFGKALGNGYAINAVIGKRSVMEAAQSTFISSTFWTERIGPSAALASLKEMKNIRSWEIITEIGLKVNKTWQKIADGNELKIQISGLPSLTGFSIESEHWLHYKTYITQEMLKVGMLASNSFYACTAHDDAILNVYFEKLNELFLQIKKFENSGNLDFLSGPVCHSGFKRLN